MSNQNNHKNSYRYVFKTTFSYGVLYVFSTIILVKSVKNNLGLALFFAWVGAALWCAKDSKNYNKTGTAKGF